MIGIVVNTAARRLNAGGRETPCLIGRAGAVPAEAKREGDGATPLGRYALRTALIRQDRDFHVETALPRRWLHPDDGWSDDPADPAYNRPVRHPHAYSAERLWREDGLYDIIVTLAHNDPPLPRRGSAIFLHCTTNKDHTEGCIAIERDALADLLERAGEDAFLDIR